MLLEEGPCADDLHQEEREEQDQQTARLKSARRNATQPVAFFGVWVGGRVYALGHFAEYRSLAGRSMDGLVRHQGISGSSYCLQVSREARIFFDFLSQAQDLYVNEAYICMFGN